MKPAARSLAPDLLLGQADFVRALARSLLADPAAAEDVSQEALVAGLERPPDEAGALRGWLARVVRNLASQRGRGEARRAARERTVARAERISSTAEVLEREAARASVVRAVLALEEPYRTVILLRFYESRAPRDIAALLDVPVETVHTRTKRALAQLREELDREFGQRSAWAALLLPFTRPPVGPTGERVPVPSSNQRKPLMNPTLKLAGLGAVLVAGAAVWLRSASPERANATPVQAAKVTVSSAMDSSGARADELPGAQRAVLLPAPAPAATTSNSTSSTVAVSTASLHLTVTWSDGTAAAGVQTSVSDVGRDSHMPLEGVTDSSGECTIDGLRPGKVWVDLDRKEFWTITEVAAGEETELAIQLARGFDVEGQVVDANGDAVAGATVWLGTLAIDPPRRFALATSAADGSFSVRSCERMKGVWARAPGHAPSLFRNLDEPEGSTVSVTLALGGTGASVTGQVLDPDGAPIEGALVLVDGQDMLHAYPQTLPGGDVTYLCHSGPTSVRTDASGNFAVDGVMPGTVPLGVLVPGLAAWRGSVSASAGSTASVAITMSAGFRLTGTVRDAAGNPVAGRVSVWAPRLSSELSPTVMTGPDGSFEIDGISPGEIHVWADGHDGEAGTTLTGEAGDELEWDAYLGPEDPEESGLVESEPWQ